MTEALILVALVGLALAGVTLMAAGNAAYARREAVRQWVKRNEAAMRRFSDAIASIGTSFAAAAASMAMLGQAIRAASEFEEARSRVEATFGAASEQMEQWATERREGLAR
jgi:hypothetical protein